MSTTITLAGRDHEALMLSLMERRATEDRSELWDGSETERMRRVLAPLLTGGVEGAVWLIGPVRAPLGYAIVTFGWSMALGGREGWVEDVFIRPSVRRRGIGTEVLHAIAVSLRQGGVRALNARIRPDVPVLAAFCRSAGFAQDPHVLMIDPL